MEIIRGPGVPTTHLPFSPAIRAGGFVFVSGQASVDGQGKIVTDTFAGEMRRSLENARLILTAAGVTFRDIVQVRSYVARAEDLAEYNQIYGEFFTEPYPTRTTIVECLGKALKFEIEMVAYVGG